MTNPCKNIKISSIETFLFLLSQLRGFTIMPMKTRYTITLTAIMLTSAFIQYCSAQNTISVGAIYHQKHTVFTDLPYDDGDISVGLGYESHTADSFWQLAVDCAWDVTGNETTDMVVSPQFNILWTDGPWFGGVGILTSYIDDSITGDDWLDAYWQLLLGAKISFLGGAVDIGARYPFESWGDVGDIDVDEISYAVWICKKLQ